MSKIVCKSVPTNGSYVWLGWIDQRWPPIWKPKREWLWKEIFMHHESFVFFSGINQSNTKKLKSIITFCTVWLLLEGGFSKNPKYRGLLMLYENARLFSKNSNKKYMIPNIAIIIVLFHIYHQQHYMFICSNFIYPVTKAVP